MQRHNLSVRARTPRRRYRHRVASITRHLLRMQLAGIKIILTLLVTNSAQRNVAS